MEKIEKPWGYEIIWAKSDKYVAKFLHINPRSRLSLQFHRKKEETIYVLEGDLKLQLDKSGSFQTLSPDRDWETKS